MILFSRAPLAPPDPAALCNRRLDALRRESDRLATLPDVRPEAVRAAPDARFAALAHPLSAAFEQLNATPAARRRSELEIRALRAAAIDLSDSERFQASLARLNGLVTGGAGQWRTGGAGLMPDSAGHHVRFPSPAAVPAQLEAIRILMRDDDAPVLLNAVVALCLLVNCHPFTDGNGRSARILFNVMLRRGGMSAHVHFPFYEIAARSRGGYVIALRSAEINGDWGPILRWILTAIRCYRALGARP